ncbi:hypothetical protein INT45_009364 [Circinella minor]|uniref:Uncharacterized protein n=1 Tax=Circinella minor TaxID=1195481 RepID=A0A8H7VM26_9FUNG|nr:hypothetical protein INT45_009364 [Circinella minor]
MKILKIAVRQRVTKERIYNEEEEAGLAALRTFNKRREQANNDDRDSSDSDQVIHTSHSNADNSSTRVQECDTLGQDNDSDDTNQSDNNDNYSLPKKRRNVDYGATFGSAFCEFQVKSLARAATGLGLCVESDLYELLALNNIIILKPDGYSKAAREHFEKHGNLLDQVHKLVMSKIKRRSQHATFSRELDYCQAAKDIEVNKGARWKCSRKLIELTEGRSDPETAAHWR